MSEKTSIPKFVIHKGVPLEGITPNRAKEYLNLLYRFEELARVIGETSVGKVSDANKYNLNRVMEKLVLLESQYPNIKALRE